MSEKSRNYSEPQDFELLGVLMYEFNRENALQVSTNPIDYQLISNSVKKLLETFDATILNAGTAPLVIEVERSRLRLYRDVVSTWLDVDFESPEVVLPGFEMYIVLGEYLVNRKSSSPQRYIDYLRDLGYTDSCVGGYCEILPSFDASYVAFEDNLCFILGPLLSRSFDPFLPGTVYKNFKKVCSPSRTIPAWWNCVCTNSRPVISVNLNTFFREYAKIQPTMEMKNILANVGMIACMGPIDSDAYMQMLPALVALHVYTGDWVTSLAIACCEVPGLYEECIERIDKNVKAATAGQLGIDCHPIDALREIGITNFPLDEFTSVANLLMSKFVNWPFEVYKNTKFQIRVQMFNNMYRERYNSEWVPALVSGDGEALARDWVLIEAAIRLLDAPEYSQIAHTHEYTQLTIAIEIIHVGAKIGKHLPPFHAQLDSPFDLLGAEQWLVSTCILTGEIYEIQKCADKLKIRSLVDFEIVEQLLESCFDSDIEPHLSSIAPNEFADLIHKTVHKRVGFVLRKVSSDTSKLHAIISATLKEELLSFVKNNPTDTQALTDWLSNGHPVEIIDACLHLVCEPRIANCPKIEKIATTCKKIKALL